MKNQIKTLLHCRSKREKILLGIVFILGIYFIFFHAFFLDTFHQIQTLQNQINKNTNYLQNHQNLNLTQDLQKANKLNQDLHTLIASINAKALPWQETLRKINQYAIAHQITLWDIDSLHEEQNYQISLSGHALMQNVLEFLNFIEQIPLIDIQTFEVSKNGHFSLQFQSHKILSSTLKYPHITPSQVLDAIKRTQRKNTFNFSIQTPQKSPKETKSQPSIKLQAIFNDKAKINGKWMSKGEKIKNFTLTEVKSEFVILRSSTSNLKLTLQNKTFLKTSKDQL